MQKRSRRRWDGPACVSCRSRRDDQLDLQSLHRVRERWVVRRTAVINQIRGLLLERGITIRKGRHHIEASLPGILEDAENKLSGALRVLLAQLQLEMQYLQKTDRGVRQADPRHRRRIEACRRLVAIPGIGPLTATATVAAIGNGAAFKKGRDLLPGWAWFPESTLPAASKN